MEVLKSENEDSILPLNMVTTDNRIQITKEEGSDHAQVFIKIEPPESGDDEIQNENYYQDPGSFFIENLSVKIEPNYYDNGEEAMDLSKTSVPLLKNDVKQEEESGENDEEYVPQKKASKKKKKKKIKVKEQKEANVKPSFSRKRHMSLPFPDAVNKLIDIVTITESERQLEHHDTWQSRKHMRYTCQDCAVGYVVEEAYIMHMKIHSPESGAHECELCHARVKTADVLYRHRLRHYRRYRCRLCRGLHKDKETAACHIHAEHERRSFPCPHCAKGFKRPQYLKKHIEQLHTKEKRYECPVCQWVCHERSRYRSHYRTHNEEVRMKPSQQPVICDVCSRQFKNKSYLKRHLLTHENGIVSCPLCLHVCKNSEVLRVHFRRSHAEDKLNMKEDILERQCPHCLRICASRALLRHHVRRMHTDRTKRYQCDDCGRHYLTKGEVRSHIAWSHQRGAGAGGGHRCPCGRVFRTPAQLRRHHARDHLRLPAPRVHRCAHCQKAFASTQVLKRHMKIHTNEKYPCKECGVEFKTQSYVNVHYKLRHLNMTRAEIKAERKPKLIHMITPLPNTIKDKKVKKQSKKEKAKVKKSESVKTNELVSVKTDEFESVKVKIERDDVSDSDIHIPLFQTFVDVPME